MPVDVDGYVTSLEDILFRRENVKKEVIIGQIKDDPQPRRIVIASFSKIGAIQRQVIGFDSKGKRVRVQDSSYKVYRGSVLRKEILYKQDWRELSETEEGRLVFNKLVEKGWTKGWGWRSYTHMKSERYTRAVLALSNERKRTIADGEDAYADTRAFKRTRASINIVKERSIDAIETLRPVIKTLLDLAPKLANARPERVLELGDQVGESIARLVDESTLLLGHFHEGIAKWR